MYDAGLQAVTGDPHKTYFGDNMSLGALMVVVLKAIANVACRSSSVIPSNFPGSMYPKQMYFIVLLLLGGSQLQRC
jgi:hypothetical protein